ncbi:protein-tyrosine phosphatase [Bifidobacterium animalis subsp. animalis MCC 0499]|uniref:arsenate reductase/protein-tyrosine-phosphatase family protein n=1 Tax=Bifidobacterium animalis TaxID=28025 RepID=UPI00069A5C88|nr:protein-tyrosine-phosphatase [Bifidobacterium animalis]KOA58817.1 protein-tyrosine phosphatase [Bifidobacterium animalis subsp. animalis MCC 0499]
MKVLFVCTGNICRSPMGELLFPLFFHSRDIETDSAGTQGLVNSPIDPSSAKLMTMDGIDSSQFRSKRLTSQLALSSDLILCFTEHQRKKIVAQTPRVRTKTFLLSDFANLCRYFSQNNILHGSSVEERMREVIYNASLVHMNLPQAEDIADPYKKDFAAFQAAHNQILYNLSDVTNALEPSRGSHAA